jgi:outer membrane protein assembly factor BamB
MLLRLFFLSLIGISIQGADQPQWGRAWSRNMTSDETGLPDHINLHTNSNVKWRVDLGTETYSSPVVSGGRVYIGTNNRRPRNLLRTNDCGVLMCFEEKAGKLIWQLLVPKREEDDWFDWPNTGLSSPATVEGDRVYLVSNRGEVLCLDAHGMANGNDGPYREEAQHMRPKARPGATNFVEQNLIEPGPTDADILWLFDLPTGAGVWTHDGAHSSILIHGDYLYLNTGTGVDKTHKAVQAPEAPGLVVLDKRSGKMVARDYEHTGPDIFHATWSSPCLAKGPRGEEIVFCGGNGRVYGFKPVTKSGLQRYEGRDGPVKGRGMPLEKLWDWDFDPSAPHEDIHRYLSNRREGPSVIYSMPVFYEGRIYLTGGGDLWWGKNEAWIKCIGIETADGKESAASIWVQPLQKHVLSTPAIYHGLAFVSDCGRSFHCFDLKDGHGLWKIDIQGDAWASPLAADGKVYLGTRDGSFYVFAATREKKLLSEAEFSEPISSTVTAANGVIYIGTASRLYAVSGQY